MVRYKSNALLLTPVLLGILVAANSQVLPIGYKNIGVDSNLNGIEESNDNNNKPTVTIYFESQCPGSRFFFKQMLSKHKTELDFKQVNLEFVPFGFASHKVLPDGKIEWKCQHGKTECHGNRLLGCAVHTLTPDRSPIKTRPDDDFPGHLKEARPRGQNILLRYMICVMSAGNPPKAGEKCAEQIGVSWIEINKCLYSSVGEEIMLAMEARTQGRDPPVSLLPWIEYDGVHWDRSYPHFIETFNAFLASRPSGPTPAAEYVVGNAVPAAKRDSALL